MKLQIGRPDKSQFILTLLAVSAFCLFENVLHRQSSIFREYEAAFLSLQWLLPVSLTVWCGMFLFLTFSWQDLPLVSLLLIVIGAYYFGEQPAIGDFTLLAGVTLGRGACFALNQEGRMKKPEVRSQESDLFLVGLIGLLAFSSWWHLDMSHNYYSGPRWMGLWNNPNIYGMLMGSGTTLAIALQGLSLKSKAQSPKLDTAKTIALSVAIFMMATGLVMSYSRGAWLAACRNNADL